MEATIKAYYKAVTTKKRYIIQEDISTNYFCMRYTATNNMMKWEDSSSYDTLIISADDYYQNLDVLAYLFKELNITYTRYCYELTFKEFLNRYELSISQYNKIKRLVK